MKPSKKKQNIIRTTLELGLIMILIVSAFNIIDSIYVNPGNSIQHQIDNPLETYTWENPYNVSQIIISENYIVFNETGFNITSTNPITIQINHIDEDISNPLDGNDNLVIFTVTNTPGDTWFNLSSFENTVSYTVKVNDIYFSTEIANSTGDINFNDNPTANDEYSIYWTAGSNTAPVISNPFPADGATGVSITGSQVNVYLSDTDGNNINVTVWSNLTGSWVQYAGYDLWLATGNAYNGFMRDVPPVGTWNYLDTGSYVFTSGWQPDGYRAAYDDITVTDDWGMTTEYTKYWWSVNCSDAVDWTNQTFSFTTEGAGLPIVQTDSETNLQEVNVTLNGELVNDGEEDTWCRFQWGNTSNPLAHTTINQTLNSGESYTVSVEGNLAEWYNSDWVYRKEITINHEFISSALSNFPVFINDTDSDYQYAQDPWGYDFVFVGSDGTTLLNYELVRFDYGSNHIEAWVNVTSISSTEDTTIYLYWGNLSATNQENLTGTWSNNYTGVYHLEEQIGSTCIDSSLNGNDATYEGTLPNRVGDGLCSYGQEFIEGNDDYISFPEGCHFNGTEGGMSVYMLPDDIDDDDYIYTQYINATNYITINHIPTTNRIYYVGRNESTTPHSWWNYHNNIFSSTWEKYGIQWNTTIANPLTSLGVLGHYTVENGIPDGDYNKIYVGTDNTELNDYEGYLDEIRFYDSLRNASWLAAEYYTTVKQDGFITYWDSESEYSDTGNMTAGTLYYYRAVANNTQGTHHGANVTFLTRPYEPELLAALMSNKTAIQLTWVQIEGSGANKTYIERSTSSTPWSRGSGTEIYNGSLLLFNDTGLSWGITYYYQAWSFANWSQASIIYHQYSSNFDSANNQTNSLPVLTNPIPANNSISDVGVDLSITINDPDGDTFNWSISTYPNISYNSGYDASNGSKTCTITPLHNTNYTWYVNCTDGYDWINRSYNFTAMITYVAVPVGGASDYVTTSNHLNLTWTNHSGSSETYRTDNYVVVQRNDTYSTSATQSDNWIRQNGTAAYFNTSWTETSGGYFTIFGWNNTASMHSYNNATPSGLDIPWGALKMQCYNEDNSTALTFDVLITNSTLVTLDLSDLTNPYYLDITDIPYGDDTIFYVSADDYESRTYYYDLELNNFYDLRFYLPFAMPPGGTDDPTYDPDNETYSTLYLISIINEYDEAVEDVKIQIMRYINESDNWVNVTILMSDANGQADVYLYDGTVYKVNISKTGYKTRTDDWIPSDSIFTKTFKIYFEDEEFEDEVDCATTVQFTAQQSGSYLFVNYTDSLSETINTTIYIYEHNYTTGNRTLYATYSNTSNSTISLTVDINSSDTYECILYYSHTTCGEGMYTRIAEGHPPGYIDDTTPDRLINLFEAMYGTNPFGWQNVIGLFVILLAFFSFGQRNSGLALMLGGGMLLFLNAFIGLTVIAISLSIVYIVLGVLMQWKNHRREEGGG